MMASVGYIFALCSLAACAHASPDSIAKGLELDATCTSGSNSPSCNLELLQVKKNAKIEPLPMDCNHTIKRFNYARPESFTPPELCNFGAAQSPIDISTFRVQQGHPEALDVTFAPMTDESVINTGYNLEVIPREDEALSRLMVDGVEYKLAQFHIHMNGEHRVNLRGAAGEMHFVFSYSNPNGMDNRTAVVGIFFDVSLNPFSKGNSLIEQMVQNIPRQGCSYPIGNINIAETFKEELSGPFWSYNGSLTTPECTENVRWQVMQRRARMSLSQYNRFKFGAYWFPANNRPTQPVNGRIIFLNNKNGKGMSSSQSGAVEDTSDGSDGPAFKRASSTSATAESWDDASASERAHKEALEHRG